MKIKTIFLSLILLLFSCSTFSSKAFKHESLLWQLQGNGIRYAEFHQLQQRIFILEIELNAPLTVELLGENNGATIETFAKEYNLDWAVNGGPYEVRPTEQGDLFLPSFYWKPARNWITHDGQVLEKMGSGRPQQGALIQESNGKWRIGLLQSLKGDEKQIGAGFQLLLEKGQFVVLSSLLASRREPRTAVGIAYQEQKLYLLVADGRSPTSRGLTLEETASILYSLGAKDAVNWDGGGSSTLVKRQGNQFQVVNSPCGHPLWGGQRRVATALGIRLQSIH